MESTKEAAFTVKATTSGLREPVTKETSVRDASMGEVSGNPKQVNGMKVTTMKTKKAGKVGMSGLMAPSSKAILSKTKSKD